MLDVNLRYNKLFLWFGCAFLVLILISSVAFGMLYSEFNREKVQMAVALNSTQNVLNQQLESTQSELKAVIAEKNNLISSAQVNGVQYNKKIGELNTQISSLANQVNQLKKPSTSKGTTGQLGSLNLYTATNTGDKICYLTFDDGPSANTLKILDVLKKGNAKATFFVIGNKHLAYTKNIYQSGNSIGLHTDTHVYNKVYASDAAYFSDLENIKVKVKAQIGVDVTMIRFPGGSSNDVSKKYNLGIMTRLVSSVKNKGYQYYDWNIDSGDAGGNNIPAATLYNNVKRETSGKKNICILMHDTDPKNTTVAALPYIISYLRGQGYRFEGLTKESDGFHHHLNN